MIVQPKIRGFICTAAHPIGCARNVQDQIEYVKQQGPVQGGATRVLVIGASTGYGLASRIVAAFGCQAKTIGVFYEKAAEGKRTATAGWYNAAAFDRAAIADGLYAKSFNGDAFSDEMKSRVVETITEAWGGVDLLIYSLASPRRQHPRTGQLSKSTLKPKGAPYTNKSIDFSSNRIITMTLPPATDDEVRQTIDVMGGEDWDMWVQALGEARLLGPRFLTLAYSYVGPEVTLPVYRNGTIGAAKDHLEQTARQLDQRLQPQGGRAFVSVNKALITQSSSAIPFIPLYFTILMKVMKQKGLHEDCIHQAVRLFKERLYSGGDIPVDEQGRIRVDDWEMRPDVQSEIQALWEEVSNDNVAQCSDLAGYHQDFLKLFGFGLEGVDYDADVEIDVPFPDYDSVPVQP